VDRHASNRHLNDDTAPVEAVGTLTVDLHRRRRGNRQLDDAAELAEPLCELVRRGWLVLLEGLALRVPRRRACREIDLGDVTLVETDEPGLEPRRCARQNQEEPGGERVQGSGVTGSSPRATTNRRDDREGRRPGRLVHEDDSARSEGPLHVDPRREADAGRCEARTQGAPISS
jgi:hypothetical protein